MGRLPLPTKEEYEKAIENIKLAMTQLEPDIRNCVVCGDGGHSACECHHNPVHAMQLQWGWRCFYCGHVMHTEEEVREHFGPEESETVSSLLTWAKSARDAETKNRPDKNIYKRSILTVWNQIISRLGGECQGT